MGISPLLFPQFIEPLSQWVRQDDKINGITLAEGNRKIALFADNVLVYLTRPAHSLSVNMAQYLGIN